MYFHVNTFQWNCDRIAKRLWRLGYGKGVVGWKSIHHLQESGVENYLEVVKEYKYIKTKKMILCGCRRSALFCQFLCLIASVNTDLCIITLISHISSYYVCFIKRIMISNESVFQVGRYSGVKMYIRNHGFYFIDIDDTNINLKWRQERYSLFPYENEY